MSILVSAITLAYFLKLFMALFFGPESKANRRIGFPTLFALLILSFVIILMGLSPSIIRAMITPAVNSLLTISAYTGVLG